MFRGTAGVLLVALASTVAAAQPAETIAAGGGATIEVTPTSTACAVLPRGAMGHRYDWLPAAYWPQLDTSGGVVTLCLQRFDDALVVVVRPAPGKVVDATLAPALRALADRERPPTTLSASGITVQPSLPVAMSAAQAIAVVDQGNPVAIGVDRASGSCGYEFALVGVKLGQARETGVPAGYWGTLFTKDASGFFCLDLAEGHLTVTINPAAALDSAGVADVLAEVRRTALDAHGAPIGVAGGMTTLPRTQQQVSLPGGTWKVIDGTRFDVAGDVLVSTAPISRGTLYSVGVAEGPCTPGPTLADHFGGARIFPRELGPVWLDTGEYKLRWRASACIVHGGASATVSVVGAVASDGPPDAREMDVLKAAVIAVARSYGMTIDDGTYVPGVGGGGGGIRSDAKATGHAFGYAGVLTLSPEGGDRRFGGLVGGGMRMGKRGGGVAGALDMELGYGGGELVGEIRGGGGFMLQGGNVVVDALAGIAVGSTGPAAALDGYVEGSVGVYGRGRVLWLGAMRAWGVGGPSHDRVELRLAIPGKARQSATFIGMRYLRFGDDPDTMLPTGSAILVTLGAGIAALN